MTDAMAQESEFRACIPMKVKFADGTYHKLGAGDPIPKWTTDHFPNPYLWWKRGIIARHDGRPVEPTRGPYEPPRAVTDEDIRRQLEHHEPRASPFPHAGPEGIGPGKDKPSGAIDPTDYELDAIPAASGKVSQATLDELQRRSRAELRRMAESLDIKVNDTDSKSEIVKKLAVR
jgi:hypothetical protein